MKSKLLTVATTVAFLAGTGLAFAQAAGGGAGGGAAGGASSAAGASPGGDSSAGATSGAGGAGGPVGGAGSPSGGAMTSPSTMGAAGTMGGSSTASAAQMQQQLTAQGYTNVTGLQPATGGGFSGQAVRNGHNVTVHIDSAGNVTSN